MDIQMPEDLSVEQPIQPKPTPSTEPPKKDLKLILAIVAILILIIIVIVLAVILFFYATPKNIERDFQINTASTTVTSTDSQQSDNDQDITWIQPTEIPSLKIFKISTSSGYTFDPEAEAKYYKVGTINNGIYQGGEVILVSFLPDGHYETKLFYHLIKMPTSTIFLFKRADWNSVDESKVVINENYQIDALQFPKEIVVPNSKQKITLYPYSDIFFENKNLKKVFTDPVWGDVYMGPVSYGTSPDLYNRNGFYLRAPDGTARVYSLSINFGKQSTGLGYTATENIDWADGKKNEAVYSYTDVSGCGSSNFASVIPESVVAMDDLKVAGTFDKENIYELKDINHQLLKELYNEKYQVFPGEKKIAYQEFIAARPIFFWQDGFGRLIKFQNTKYGPIAECGKPVIYLYPTATQEIEVKVEPQGGMSYSDPAYNEGWTVKAEPNGKLTEISSGKKYPYLFWEGKGGIYDQPKKGFVVKKEKVHNFLKQKLSQLGLNAQETADFMEFWEPRMQSAPYYFITFLGNYDMDKLAPLTINPKPDTIIRILMDFEPLQKPIEAEGFNIKTPERKGFTVVEWGGVIR